MYFLPSTSQTQTRSRLVDDDGEGMVVVGAVALGLFDEVLSVAGRTWDLRLWWRVRRGPAATAWELPAGA